MSFNSYEKDKFVVGKEYYTYYFDITNRGNAIKDYTGIMKVKVISNDPTKISPKGYTKFDILESKKLGSTIAHNIHYYMNGYGLANTDFYEDKDECIKAHDKRIITFAEGLSTTDREKMLKKLINEQKPNVSKKEEDSKQWYKELSKTEKEYVKWIKEYWDEI